MSSLDEIRNTRIGKLKKLSAAGLDPYPSSARRDATLAEAAAKFEKLSGKKSVALAGRIMAIRKQGGLIFFNINDGTGLFQVLLKKDENEKSFALFDETMDIGDFIGVSGALFVTKRGEKTIEAHSWEILAKSLRPLPEKWHGLTDEDERFRKRYLDIMFSDEAKAVVEKRFRFWDAARRFLIKEGFIEVETPILENTAGGAEAKPFVTHYNAYDTDVFLRISPELWLKRLMVAGFEKVFEIGRVFRNEGADAEHLQDYTALEFYRAYANYTEGMEFVRDFYMFIAEETFGTLKFKIKGFDVDFGKKWETYDFVSLIKKETGIDILAADARTMKEKLHELKIEYDAKGFNRNRGIDALWKYCRRKIAGPGFLIGVPTFMEPLAKRSKKNPELVERFQVILAGSEMGKGFSELNDPIDQAGRFNDQAKLRAAGDEEAQMADADFVEALEYGMPPTFGFGFSERLFSFLCDKPMRETQIFPFMRPKKDKE